MLTFAHCTAVRRTTAAAIRYTVRAAGELLAAAPAEHRDTNSQPHTRAS